MATRTRTEKLYGYYPATERVSVDTQNYVYDINHPLGPRWVPEQQPLVSTDTLVVSVDFGAPNTPPVGTGVYGWLKSIYDWMSGNAATAAKQDIGNASLGSIDGKTPALVAGRVPVDGSGVTQPVSGTFWQATQPVSAVSLPLPTGAATSALQPALTATLNNGSEATITVAAQVLAANVNRKAAVIQNTGTVNVRIGATGVTATTGLRLTPGASVTFEQPNVPTNAIFAVSEGAATTVLAQEIT